nr:CPBP family intramembrane glutamic endopeptidase [Cohnella mopanensis]
MYRLWEKKANWSISLRQRKGFTFLSYGGLVAGVVIGVGIAGIIATGTITVGTGLGGDWTRLFIPLVGFFLVAVSEEAFFRGYLFGLAQAEIGMKGAILVNIIVFSLIHLTGPQALDQPIAIIIVGQLNTILITLVLIGFRLRTGGLWMPIGFHWIWNFIQSSVFGFINGGKATESIWQVAYPSHSIWNGGMYGLEASILITPLMVVLLLFFRTKMFSQYVTPSKTLTV